MPKPIGLQLYTLREQAKADFLGVLRKVAETGYVAVEFAGLHGQTPQQVRAWLDDLGLVACSAHMGLTTKDNLQQQVDAAAALGFQTIVGGWKREDWDSLDGIRRAAEAWQHAAELLKPHGLSAAYHNHWWEMKQFYSETQPTKRGAVVMLEPKNPKYGLEIFAEAAPAVGLQIDVYWACNFGKVDAPALVKKWAKRAPLLHLKDGPLVEGQPHTAVGAGKMDIPAVVAAADKKVLKWLIVELDSCATDMTQAAVDSYTYLTGKKLAQGKR